MSDDLQGILKQIADLTEHGARYRAELDCLIAENKRLVALLGEAHEILEHVIAIDIDYDDKHDEWLTKYAVLTRTEDKT